MARKRKGKKKAFHYFPALPPEIQMVVVGAMRPKDRCRFQSTSKLSWKEVKSSQNHIYALELEFDGVAVIEIRVVLSEYLKARHTWKCDGFRLMFEKHEDNKKCIAYKRLSNDDTLWKIDLDDDIDLIKCGLDHFNKILSFHSNNIRVLVIEGKISNQEHLNYEFNTKRFSKLEKLQLFNGIPAHQFLPKIRLPLKELIAHDEQIVDFEQICEVCDILRMFNLQLNYQQFLNLSAKRTHIHVGRLTEQDIYNFIQLWKNGEYKGTMEKCIWNIENSDFNVNLLWQLLGNFEDPQRSDTIEIVQKESKEKATVFLCISDLYFTMGPEDEESDESDEDVESDESDENDEDEEEEEDEEEVGMMIREVENQVEGGEDAMEVING